MKVTSDMASNTNDSYAEAGAIVEETFSQLRTVLSLSLEDKLSQKYNEKVAKAEKAGIKKGAYTALGLGTTMCIMFCCYGLAFWYGSILIAQDQDKVWNTLPLTECSVPANATFGTLCLPTTQFKSVECMAKLCNPIVNCIKGDNCFSGGE
jgi:hypothetical protein